MALEGIFANLESLGMFDVMLPFVLIFTIVFAVLQKAKIFGKDSKNFNVVIALVMGLAVVVPHVLGYYSADADIVNIINQALPNVSVVVVAIVMALIIIGVMGRRFELGDTSISGWIAFIAFGIVVFIFGAAANWWNAPWLQFLLGNEDLLALVIVILVFAIIINMITKEPKEKADDKTLGGKLGKLLQKD